MFVHFEIIAPGKAPNEQRVDGPRILLGRDPASHVSFDGKTHSAVSWTHARIDVTEAGASITDLNSSNGTFVNGVLVSDPQPLQHGDVIGLGLTGPKLRVVEVSNGPAPDKPPTVSERMLPHDRTLIHDKLLPNGLLTPPVGNKPINVSSDSLTIRPPVKRRRVPLIGAVLGVCALAAVTTAGIVVFNSQQKGNGSSEEVAEVKPPEPAVQPKEVEPKKIEFIETPIGSSGIPSGDPAKDPPPNEAPRKDPPPKDVPIAKTDDKDKKAPPLASPPPPLTKSEPPDEQPNPAPVRVKPKDVGPTLIGDPPPAGMTADKIYKRTLRSVGWINSSQRRLGGNQVASATGALIDEKLRLFLTAYHVVEGRSDHKIFFPDYDGDGNPIADRRHYFQSVRPVAADVLVTEPLHDLAVLRLRESPADVPALPLSPKNISVTQRIFTVGNPGNASLWLWTEGSVRQVAKKRMRLDNGQELHAWMIEAQLAINSGDSGGPVVNDQCEIVGVNCAKDDRAQLLSSLIDIREIRDIVEQARQIPIPPLLEKAP